MSDPRLDSLRSRLNGHRSQGQACSHGENDNLTALSQYLQTLNEESSQPQETQEEQRFDEFESLRMPHLTERRTYECHSNNGSQDPDMLNLYDFAGVVTPRNRNREPVNLLASRAEHLWSTRSEEFERSGYVDMNAFSGIAFYLKTMLKPDESLQIHAANTAEEQVEVLKALFQFKDQLGGGTGAQNRQLYKTYINYVAFCSLSAQDRQLAITGLISKIEEGMNLSQKDKVVLYAGLAYRLGQEGLEPELVSMALSPVVNILDEYHNREPVDPSSYTADDIYRMLDEQEGRPLHSHNSHLCEISQRILNDGMFLEKLELLQCEDGLTRDEAISSGKLNNELISAVFQGLGHDESLDAAGLYVALSNRLSHVNRSIYAGNQETVYPNSTSDVSRQRFYQQGYGHVIPANPRMPQVQQGQVSGQTGSNDGSVVTPYQWDWPVSNARVAQQAQPQTLSVVGRLNQAIVASRGRGNHRGLRRLSVSEYYGQSNGRSQRVSYSEYHQYGAAQRAYNARGLTASRGYMISPGGVSYTPYSSYTINNNNTGNYSRAIVFGISDTQSVYYS